MILMFVIGFWWIVFPLFSAALVCVGLFYLIKRIHLKWMAKGIQILLLIISIFIFSSIVKVFFLEIFLIPSESMENTLLIGDRIVVNKLDLGPKLPRSPFDIPWFNIFFLLREDAIETRHDSWWDYHRIAGLNKITHNDILVFSTPMEGAENKEMIKRCVALPGDTLSIRDGEVFINTYKQEMPDQVVNNYLIYSKEWEDMREMIKTYGLSRDHMGSTEEEGYTLQTPLTLEYARIMIDHGYVIEPVAVSTNPKLNHRNSLSWYVSDFGPIVVPKKDMVIPLNEETHAFYNHIMTTSENKHIIKRGNSFFLDDKQITEITFTKDYYFMMGDNRPYSIDSRYWGFLSEERVIGKASLVFLSTNKGQMRWDRLFKRI